MSLSCENFNQNIQTIKKAVSILPEVSFNTKQDSQDWLKLAKAGGGIFSKDGFLCEDNINFTRQFAMDYFVNKTDQKSGEAYFDREKLSEKYFSPKELQVEKLYLHQSDWSIFPEKTKDLAEKMHHIAIFTMKNILHALNIPEDLHGTITGGLTDYQGNVDFKVSHYDHTQNFIGIRWHYDIDWITVLHVSTPGLLVKVDGEEKELSFENGSFVVFLGIFFEELIGDRNKVSAIYHHVRQLTENENNRITWGVFCNAVHPDDKKGYYQWKENALHWNDGIQQLIEDKLKDQLIGKGNTNSDFHNKLHGDILGVTSEDYRY